MILIRTTAGSFRDAEMIVGRLLDERVISCGQMSEVRSMYRWKDEVQNDEEVLIEVKTTKTLLDVCLRMLRSLHPYELPVIEWTELSTNAEAELWIASETSDAVR